MLINAFKISSYAQTASEHKKITKFKNKRLQKVLQSKSKAFKSYYGHDHILKTNK